MDDGDLVRQALAGRKEAFADLAHRWSPRITAMCHARTRRADVADDLAQETLLRGFRSLHTLVDPPKVGSWLMGIAYRASLDWLKAKERTTRTFSSIEADEQFQHAIASADKSSDDALCAADEQQQLLVEVAALPDELREVLMLYYYNDFTYRELADLLGVSPATINARLTRARSILRERLGVRSEPC